MSVTPPASSSACAPATVPHRVSTSSAPSRATAGSSPPRSHPSLEWRLTRSLPPSPSSRSSRRWSTASLPAVTRSQWSSRSTPRPPTSTAALPSPSSRRSRRWPNQSRCSPRPKSPVRTRMSHGSPPSSTPIALSSSPARRAYQLPSATPPVSTPPPSKPALTTSRQASARPREGSHARLGPRDPRDRPRAALQHLVGERGVMCHCAQPRPAPLRRGLARRLSALDGLGWRLETALCEDRQVRTVECGGGD